MGVYVAVLAIAILFLVGSYLALGRNSEPTVEQLATTVHEGAEELRKMAEEMWSGQPDLEAIRRRCSGWQMRLEVARDIEAHERIVVQLIQGFSLVEWTARLRLQGEKTEDPAFAAAASTLLESVAVPSH